MDAQQVIRVIITLFINLYFSAADGENLGRCGDPDCTVPVAVGKTVQMYHPNVHGRLWFKPGEDVEIYVRDYGEKKDMLGVKINKRKGYVPKAMIRENKVLQQNADFPATRNFTDESSLPNSRIPVNPTSLEEPATEATATDVSSPLDPLPTSSSKLELEEFSSTSYTSEVATLAEQFKKPTSGSTGDILEPKQNLDAGFTPQNSINNGLTAAEEQDSDTPNLDQISVQKTDLTSSPSASNHEVTTPSFTSLESISLHTVTFHSENELRRVSSAESIAKYYATATQKTVKKTVEALVSHHDTSLGGFENDAGMRETLSLLSKQSVNIEEILNDQESLPSNIDSSFDSVTGKTVGHYSYTSSNVESQIASTKYPDIPLDPSSASSISVSNDIHHTAGTANVEAAVKTEDFEQLTGTGISHEETEFPGDRSQTNFASEEGTDVNHMHAGENSSLPDGSDGGENELDENVSANESEGEVKSTFGDSMSTYKELEKSKEHEDSTSGNLSGDFDISDLSNGIVTQSSEISEGSEYVPSVSTSDINANFGVVSKLDLEYKEKEVFHSNDLPEKQEEFSTVTTLKDDFHSQADTHISPQRHILQDNNSDPATADYDSNDSGSASKSIETFPESPESDNPKEKGEIVEPSSLFSIVFVYETCSNSVAALRTVLDSLILLMPESLHSYITSSGISARAVVFTGIIAFPCALLVIATFFLKERSKEQRLTDLLRETEHKLYLTSAERDILRDESKNLKQQLVTIDENLAEEKSLNLEMQRQLQDMEFLNKSVSSKQRANVDVIKELQIKNDEYVKELKDLKFALKESKKQTSDVTTQLLEEQNTISYMTDEIAKLKMDIEELEAEKDHNENDLLENEKLYKEKISQLEQSCSQLLQEAEVWNTRVNELDEQLYSHLSSKEELERVLESKELEIESLKTAFSNMEVFQNLKESGESEKTVEEKMKAFMDVSSVRNELKKAEDVNKSLTERFQQERNKVLDLEVELVESESDVEKMKANYNQALQDKAEAQTKLDVLTKYFKDKELQLQKELGVQEAFRQRKEEDATHAERRVLLIEKENESYKYQVASLKQEIEETERNLKNQIASQEKKAHENWLAARAAERKAEELKQECSHLRQRLTLLEREQENWLNSSQSDIVRPIPQRVSDTHDLSSSHEGSISSEFTPRHMPPPGMLDELPLPMRSSSRPLLPPGVPPVPMMPPPPPHFIPPFDPIIPLPPHRPQPWRLLPEKHFDSQRRNTPSEFEASVPRRHQTPPYFEGDRRSSSPVDQNSRSRGSSPREALPDFHNIPPPLQRHPDYFPPGPMPRFPPNMHRSYKGLPPPRTGNRPGSNRPINDKELRQPHSDADV